MFRKTTEALLYAINVAYNSSSNRFIYLTFAYLECEINILLEIIKQDAIFLLPNYYILGKITDTHLMIRRTSFLVRSDDTMPPSNNQQARYYLKFYHAYQSKDVYTLIPNNAIITLCGIEELAIDGICNQPYSKIGRFVGLNARIVNKQVRTLEKKGYVNITGDDYPKTITLTKKFYRLLEKNGDKFIPYFPDLHRFNVRLALYYGVIWQLCKDSPNNSIQMDSQTIALIKKKLFIYPFENILRMLDTLEEHGLVSLERMYLGDRSTLFCSIPRSHPYY